MKSEAAILRISADTALMFLEDMKNGLMELRGNEPAIRDVVSSVENFELRPREGDELFTSGNGKVWLSALSFLYEHQAGLLNEKVTKLRSHPTFKVWEDNLIRDDL